MAGTQTPAKPAETKRAETKTPTAEEAKVAAEKAAKEELDFISGGAVILTPELTKKAAPTNARNERQQAMDKVVYDAHQQWLRSGKQSQWGHLVENKSVLTYFVDPDKTAGLKKMINRAAAFHGTRVRWGSSFKASAEIVKRYGLPENHVGREVVSFAIMDRRPRTTSTTSTTETKS